METNQLMMDQRTLNRLQEEQVIRLARKDINTFNEYVLLDARDNSRVTQADIHLSWQEFIEWAWSKGKNAGVLAPWGHGKSSQLIGRILFEIGKNPGIRMKMICNGDDLASERVSTVKAYIADSEDYHRVFPDVVPNKNAWATKRITVERRVASPDPTLSANGILSTGIGGRADMLIFDDPVDHRNAIAEPKKQIQVIDTFYNTWMSRLEPGGKACMIATRWTMTDLIAELMKQTGWVWLVQRISNDFSCIEEEVVSG